MYLDHFFIFQLIFVFITYGAPAPKAAVLQKSINGGQSFVPMQYMADDCPSYFGIANDQPLSHPDDVNCITSYSRYCPSFNVKSAYFYFYIFLFLVGLQSMMPRFGSDFLILKFVLVILTLILSYRIL